MQIAMNGLPLRFVWLRRGVAINVHVRRYGIICRKYYAGLASNPQL